MKVSKNTVLICTVGAFISLAAFFIYFTVPGEAKTARVAVAEVTTVAAGLHNPRGLNFAPNGDLFVAEAAANGTPSGLCGEMGDGSTKCAASTSSIARIDVGSGELVRVLSGLPSLIAPSGNGSGGSGVQDVSFQGMGNGYFTVGLGGDPTKREEYFEEFGNRYARIGRFNPSGNYSLKQDLGGYEAANNPDGVVPDSNPFGLFAVPGGLAVADAGGNDLLRVAANGEISTLAVFPRVNRPPGSIPPQITSVQAVTTSVTLCPDGYLYVGQLTGGPFTVGIANVYRVPQGGGIPEVAYTGFTNIIDVTCGSDGTLYVLEIARNAIPNFGQGGRLVRVEPDGTRSDVISGPPLIAPGGVAIGPDGALYVTNMSTSPTDGAVLRIEQ
jgi:hypothetical protein